MTKTCTKCRQPKPLADFSPKATARDGLHPYCKLCKAAAQRESRRKNPGYDREYYRRFPEKRKAKVKARRERAKERMFNVKH